jgi:hypothetical protein
LLTLLSEVKISFYLRETLR